MASAFSVGAVLRWGIGGLQEHPLLVVLAGLNLCIVSVVPQLISLPVEIVMEFVSVSGALGEMEVEAIKALVGLTISFLSFPIQQLIVAGAYGGWPTLFGTVRIVSACFT